MDAPLNNSLEYCSQLWATDPKKLLIRPLVNALFCGYLMSQLTQFDTGQKTSDFIVVLECVYVVYQGLETGILEF